MLTFNLHPAIHSTLIDPPAAMDQTMLHVDTRALWKVTLGFLPFYVNLHKRLYDQHEMECQELESSAAQRVIPSPWISSDEKIIIMENEHRDPSSEPSDSVCSSTPSSLPADVEWRDSIVEEECSSSMPTLPDVEWSDINEESSTGWSDSDTTTFQDTSSYSDSSASSGYDTVLQSNLAYLYSDVSSDESSWSSEYSTWRKNPKTADNLSWMEKVSRAVFGSPIP
jgi:hypothetical protein